MLRRNGMHNLNSKQMQCRLSVYAAASWQPQHRQRRVLFNLSLAPMSDASATIRGGAWSQRYVARSRCVRAFMHQAILIGASA
jgi:hypothetical protein